MPFLTFVGTFPKYCLRHPDSWPNISAFPSFWTGLCLTELNSFVYSQGSTFCYKTEPWLSPGEAGFNVVCWELAMVSIVAEVPVSNPNVSIPSLITPRISEHHRSRAHILICGRNSRRNSSYNIITLSSLKDDRQPVDFGWHAGEIARGMGHHSKFQIGLKNILFCQGKPGPRFKLSLRTDIHITHWQGTGHAQLGNMFSLQQK